jgi:hypothetical protein
MGHRFTVFGACHLPVRLNRMLSIAKSIITLAVNTSIASRPRKCQNAQANADMTKAVVKVVPQFFMLGTHRSVGWPRLLFRLLLGCPTGLKNSWEISDIPKLSDRFSITRHRSKIAQTDTSPHKTNQFL